MRTYRNIMGRGIFSLMELAVILVVLGVVATIVGPRMSRANSSSPRVGEQLLVGHLRALRGAIRTYANEHGGHFPDGDAASVTQQLTQCTDWAGVVSPTRTARHRLGPYLREIPPLPVGNLSGNTSLCITNQPAAQTGGWTYDPATGRILPNTTLRDLDSLGVPYSNY